MMLILFSSASLQAGKLSTYRFCDNVWTFMLNDVEFREVHELAKVDKVKIVACDGKSKWPFLMCQLIYYNAFTSENTSVVDMNISRASAADD